MNELIEIIALELEKEANKNHIFKETLIGNVIEVPVLKNADSVTKAASNREAFILENPIEITYRKVDKQQYVVRGKISKDQLNENNIKSILFELASSLKRNIGLREDVITYGDTILTFKMPGRGPETYLLDTADNQHYELRAYASFALAIRE